MKKHLAIMDMPAIEAILSGRKTIETRFSKHRIPPFGEVGVGDIVYLKPPGKEIVGQFRVKKVFSFEGLTIDDVDKIFKDFADKINIGDDFEDKKYHKDKQASKFGTLIFISESEKFLTSPLKIEKKDLRGWVILS